MKKEAKIFLAVLAGSCAVAAAISLAACGKKDKEQPHTHAYGQWSITTPNANHGGWAEKVCSGCDEATEGHKITVELPAITDSRYTVTNNTATCTVSGTATYTITVDGYEVSFTAVTAAKGHSLGSQVAATEADCEHAGNNAYYQCQTCHKYFEDAQARTELQENQVIIPPSHSYVPHDAVTPTCTNGGKAKYYTCDNCSRIFDENYEECDESDLLLPPKHNYGLENPAVPATCTSSGNIAWCECLACHAYFKWEDKTQIEAAERFTTPLGHDIGEKVEAKEPTCTEPGNLAYYPCNRCLTHFSDPDGEHEINSAVNSKGHAFVCSDLTEPQEEGGDLSMTCQNGCGTSQTLHYDGTLAKSSSASAPTEIPSAGKYYVKANADGAARYMYFKLPIPKAGTYRVTFTNIDSNSPRRVVGFGNYPVQFFSSANAQVGRTQYRGSTTGLVAQLNGAASGCSFTGEIVTVNGLGEFRGFEFTSDETFAGGYLKIWLGFSTAITADAPLPFIIEVTAPDSQPAQVSAKEYAYDPRKNEYAVEEQDYIAA